MTFRTISIRLKKALEEIGDEIRTDKDALFQIMDLGKQKYPSVSYLLDALRANPALDVFNGRLHRVANRGMQVEIENLAIWLIRRGSIVGSTRAVAGLQKYLRLSEIPFSMAFGLTGINIDHQCNLGHGIKLVPWEKFPDTSHKDLIYSTFSRSVGFKWPSAVILQEKILPVPHIAEKLRQDSGPYTPIDDSELRDVILCIGAVGPFATEELVTWLEPPPWAPVIGQYLNISIPEGLPRNDVWKAEHCKPLLDLFKKFRTLVPKEKDALRLPMQRLNMAMRRNSKVDSAVDLGIALESLFLNNASDTRGELTFKLQLRVARYIEKTQEKRADIFQLMGDLYNLRSKAVHTGRIPEKIKNKPTFVILREGYKITAESIRLFILEGRPDWAKIQLN